MRRYDAIICDVDGCLQAEAHEPLDPRGLARLADHNREARDSGAIPPITLCTGRPQPYAEAVCRLIANTTLPIVCEMGVWLWHPDTNRFDRDPAISDDDLETIHACQRWIEHEFGPAGVAIQPGKVASISLYHDDTDYLKGLTPGLEREFDARGWDLRIGSTWHWINIELRHVSKATGIERMMRHTGLETQRLAGIGDTMGDLAIREHVAFFACPANADDRLKGHADYVSPQPELAGVLDIVERLRDGHGFCARE